MFSLYEEVRKSLASWITDHIITIFKANKFILDSMEGGHIPCMFAFSPSSFNL